MSYKITYKILGLKIIINGIFAIFRNCEVRKEEKFS